MAKIFTEEGLKKLHAELDERRGALRQEIAEAIKEAKEQGDLSENAEYSEAKRRQNENETRIAELEMTLKESVVAAPHKRSSNVQIGSTVEVKVRGAAMKFEIVGSNEVDPAAGKISNESPIGQALMGKSKGDVATVTTPAGHVKYEVLSVK